MGSFRTNGKSSMRLVARQALLRAAAVLLPSLQWLDHPSNANAAANIYEVPLRLCGGAYCVEYSVDGQPFRAVVDTGSPFLTVDGTCTTGVGRWGCYRGDGAAAAGLADSELSFAGQDVLVKWRRGEFALGSPTTDGSRVSVRTEPLRIADATFGIVRGSRSSFGSSAIFLGLVKGAGSRLGRYPTLLSQTSILSMRFDFLRRRMLLSDAPQIPADSDAVPIVDLRARGAPDLKYACEVKRLLINGREVLLDAPTVAIVDTGTTGLTLSEELYESRPEFYAERAAAVRIELQTDKAGICALEASVRRRRSAATGIPSIDVDLASAEFDEFPLVVSPVPIRWGTGRRGTPYVLFVGLAFLWQRQVTIDIDRQRLSVV